MFCGDTTSGNLDFIEHIVYDKESDPLSFALGSNYFLLSAVGKRIWGTVMIYLGRFVHIYTQMQHPSKTQLLSLCHGQNSIPKY